MLNGKRGSIVAIEPSTGEILVTASAPSYDPNLLSGRELGNNFEKIKNDSTAPLFNRAIQATYPPGSIFKTVQALIALMRSDHPGRRDPIEPVQLRDQHPWVGMM